MLRRGDDDRAAAPAAAAPVGMGNARIEVHGIAGFDRVFFTILDTHVASLISAAFLFNFGNSLIRGFALTLTIGLLANVFTAYFVSRTLFEATLAGRNVPVWLNEGLATVFESQGIAGERPVGSDRSSLSLARLEGTFSRLSAAEAHTAYALSERAVQKMLQLRGAPAVVTLLQDIGRGIPFASAFQQRIAMRYDDFQLMVARE